MDSAAIAATEYLIDNLVQLVSVKNDRSTEEAIGGEVEQLTADLNYLNSFLKCASSNKIKGDRLKELLSHVREAVYHAEDAVDTFLTRTLEIRSKSWIRRVFSRPRSIKLERIARQVHKVRQQVEAVYGEKSELEKMLLDLEFFTIPEIASKDDAEKNADSVISLSYQELPYHLKPCFLYFGMFPEGFEIPTWKLFRMWIAEGFIRDKSSETSERYLEELVSRNLVSVGKRSPGGKIKTCRVHESVGEFCTMRAREDNECFFKEITKSGDGLVNDDMNYGRLCIHSNISKFLASRPHGRRVRSFVCFSKEDHTLAPEHISAITEGFKLLRVLDLKPIRFSKITTRMYELLHLRYIHLSFKSSVLPKSFSKLWNIQTLIVETPGRTLEIKADIWKMRHLRHVKTSAITMLPQPAKDGAQDEHNIRTLGTISTKSCTGIVLGKARNLKRVSIRGNLSMLLTSSRRTGGGVSFDYMAKLSELEELKLQNDVFPLRPSDRKMPYLPPSRAFPPNLKILTLSGTYLDWSQMKVLASLYNLEVLKLKEMAFMGKYWEADDGGFNRLRVLFIGRTDLVVWKISAGSFPNLSHLELHNCQQLREVPIEFAQNPGLDVLIKESASASADREAKGDKAK